MADAVATKVHDQGALVVVNATNTSDGTGESAVKKVDASDLGAASLAIRKIKWSTRGMGVNVLFDATTDANAFSIPADDNDEITFEPPLRNPVASGATGDIMFTTVGHTAGDFYAVQLELVKTALVA